LTRSPSVLVKINDDTSRDLASSQLLDTLRECTHSPNLADGLQQTSSGILKRSSRIRHRADKRTLDGQVLEGEEVRVGAEGDEAGGSCMFVLVKKDKGRNDNTEKRLTQRNAQNLSTDTVADVADGVCHVLVMTSIFKNL